MRSATANTNTVVYWRPLMLLLCVFGFCLAACGGPSTPAASLDQSTPEATIRSLYDAINRSDLAAVQRLVEPGDKDSEPFIKGLGQLFSQGVTWQISDLEVDVVANDGDVARARSSQSDKVVLKSGQVYMEGPTSNLHTLARRNGRWYFRGLGQQVPPGWIIR
jgi:hypothetical protein